MAHDKPRRTPIAAKGYAHPETLVSTEWLAEHLERSVVRILESDEDVLLYDRDTFPARRRSTGTSISTIRGARLRLARAVPGTAALEGNRRLDDRRASTATRTTGGRRTPLGVPALRLRERAAPGRRPHEVGSGGTSNGDGRSDRSRARVRGAAGARCEDPRVHGATCSKQCQGRQARGRALAAGVHR